MSTPIDTATVQQLDPLGTLDGRPASIAAVVGALAFSAMVTWSNLATIAHPVLANLALVFIALSAITFVVGTSPLRPRFSGELHAIVVGFVVIGFALSSASQGDAGALLTDFWGPMVIGTTCLSVAPYRPIPEIVAVGVAASIFTGLFNLQFRMLLNPP